MKEVADQEDIINQVQEVLQKRGKKVLELARKTVLEDKIEHEEVSEALKYFMTEYWHDVARPALLSIVCEAVGGNPESIIPIAIPLSLISGAIDIHDDIIDQSDVKGSKSTVFGKYGKNIALLVGDALLFKGFNLIQHSIEKGISVDKVLIISDIIKKTFFELGNAEALELNFRGNFDVTPEEYLKVVKKKAADVEAHTRISAILGNGTKKEIKSLSEYGRFLGMLIILRDDMIDTLDIEETVHRIKNEHISLPIIYAIQNPVTKSELAEICLKEKISKNDYKKILALIMKAKGLDLVDEYMQKIAKEALEITNKIEKNKELLKILIKGMTLPEWRDYLSPPNSNW
ncbi:MAG: class 1 isoprenoid biosynthesis enzyme [Candidatus Bathyarchaeota archaeon]